MNEMTFTPTNLQDLDLDDVRNTLEDERARLIKQLHKEPQAGQDGQVHPDAAASGK